MKYNFDEIIDRTHTGSMKWDIEDNVLPMWVADMDFKTNPEILDAFNNRIKQGVLGYTLIEDEWYKSYINWWKKRHDLIIDKDSLIFTTGVVPAISSIVRSMTHIAEYVVVMTPVYNIFFNSIINNGRYVLENKLLYQNGTYSIDWQDLEEKLSHPQTSLLLLCNPHNPIGRIWDKETLQRIGELCHKHNVVVVSDEIHCDITEPGKTYIPYAGVSDICKNNSITCMAPTKAFNIAGIQTAAVMIPNEIIRNRVNRRLNTDEVAEPNVLASIAPIAAFNKGEEWLDALREYLWINRKYAENYIKKEIPDLYAAHQEATYLLWIDCTKIIGHSSDLCQFLKEHSGLYLCDGMEYKNGTGFLRMNLATPLENVKEGLKRLKKGVEEYQKYISSIC